MLLFEILTIIYYFSGSFIYEVSTGDVDEIEFRILDDDENEVCVLLFIANLYPNLHNLRCILAVVQKAKARWMAFVLGGLEEWAIPVYTFLRYMLSIILTIGARHIISNFRFRFWKIYFTKDFEILNFNPVRRSGTLFYFERKLLSSWNLFYPSYETFKWVKISILILFRKRSLINFYSV